MQVTVAAAFIIGVGGTAVAAPTTIRGTVFADADRDGVQGPDERGVAHAVVAFETDAFAITDDAGHFAIDVPATSPAHGIVWVRVPDGFTPGPVWARYDGRDARVDLGVVPLPAPIRAPFSIAVASDSHIHTHQEQFGLSDLMAAERLATASDPPPAFFTILGDITQGNRDHEFDLVDASISELDLPWVPVPGNHDQYDAGDTWRRRYGPDNYSFDVANVHFVVWNFFVPDDDIVAWVTADLAHVDPRLTIVGLAHGAPSAHVIAALRTLGMRYLLTGHAHTNRVIDHGAGGAELLELNAEPFIMGGLDFTPAGYRVLTFGADGTLAVAHHAIVDAPVLAVMSPARGECTPARDAQLLVAAELDAGATTVRATIDCDEPIELRPGGGWTWLASLSPLRLEEGPHTLRVEAASASGTFAHVDTAFEVCEPMRGAVTGEWSQVQGDAAHVGARARELTPPLATRWTAAVGGHVLQAQPVIAHGTVFVVATDLARGDTGALVALDLATGTVRWRHASTAQLRGGAAVVPLASGDVVVVAQQDGTVLGLDATTGAERWRVALGAGVEPEAANIDAAPVVDHGDVLIGNQRALAAIDGATGALEWTVDPVPTGINSMSFAALAIGDGVALGTFNRALGGLIAWDRETGRELWHIDDDRAIAINASPVIADRVAYVVNGVDQVFAVDVDTGAARWRVSLDAAGFDWGNATVGTPALAHDTLVVPTLYGDIVALDPESGAERWRHRGGASPIHTTHYRAAHMAGFEASPIITGDLVWIGGTDGALVALDLHTGAELWRTNVGAPILAGAALADDGLVVASFDGTVRLLARAVPRPPIAPIAQVCAKPAAHRLGWIALLLAIAALLSFGAAVVLSRRGRR